MLVNESGKVLSTKNVVTFDALVCFCDCTFFFYLSAIDKNQNQKYFIDHQGEISCITVAPIPIPIKSGYTYYIYMSM